jgi:hypothetical protein
VLVVSRRVVWKTAFRSGAPPACRLSLVIDDPRLNK